MRPRLQRDSQAMVSLGPLLRAIILHEHLVILARAKEKRKGDAGVCFARDALIGTHRPCRASQVRNGSHATYEPQGTKNGWRRGQTNAPCIIHVRTMQTRHARRTPGGRVQRTPQPCREEHTRGLTSDQCRYDASLAANDVIHACPDWSLSIGGGHAGAHLESMTGCT